jgi:hypothetical protein
MYFVFAHNELKLTVSTCGKVSHVRSLNQLREGEVELLFAACASNLEPYFTINSDDVALLPFP